MRRNPYLPCKICKVPMQGILNTPTFCNAPMPRVICDRCEFNQDNKEGEGWNTK